MTLALRKRSIAMYVSSCQLLCTKLAEFTGALLVEDTNEVSATGVRSGPANP